MQINIKIFYTLVLNLLVGVVGHIHIANQTAEFLEGVISPGGRDELP